VLPLGSLFLPKHFFIGRLKQNPKSTSFAERLNWIGAIRGSINPYQNVPNRSPKVAKLGQQVGRGARNISRERVRDPSSRDARRRQRKPASAMSTVPEYNVHARKKEHPKVYAVRALPMPYPRLSRGVASA
jgi:hypothetical protein